MKLRVWQRWHNFFGHTLHLRFEPKAFKDDVRTIESLFNGDRYEEARELVEAAYRRWGCDAEIVRLSTFFSFMTDELSEGADRP